MRFLWYCMYNDVYSCSVQNTGSYYATFQHLDWSYWKKRVWSNIVSMFSSICQLEKFNPKNDPKWSNFDPDFQGNWPKIWTLNFASVTCGRPLPTQHTMKRDETLWKDASWSVEHNPKIWARLEKCLSIFSSPTFRSKFSLGGSLYRAPPVHSTVSEEKNVAPTSWRLSR